MFQIPLINEPNFANVRKIKQAVNIAMKLRKMTELYNQRVNKCKAKTHFSQQLQSALGKRLKEDQAAFDAVAVKKFADRKGALAKPE